MGYLLLRLQQVWRFKGCKGRVHEVADSAIEFAKAVSCLIDNTVLRNSIGHQEHVDKNHSWQQLNEKFFELISKLIVMVDESFSNRWYRFRR